MKENGASVQYPMLTYSNYNEWAMLMQVNMEAQGIWYAIEPEEEDVIEYRDDRFAMAAILRSVPPKMLSAVEQWCKPPPVIDNQGRLLMCEEEWRAKLKIQDAEKGNVGSSGGSSNASGGDRKNGWRARGRGRGGSKPGHTTASPMTSPSARTVGTPATGPRIAGASQGRVRPTWPRVRNPLLNLFFYLHLQLSMRPPTHRQVRCHHDAIFFDL